MAKLVLGPCCSVEGCSLRPGTNLLSEIKVYRFPKETNQRNAWIAAVQRPDWTPSVNSRVCSTHFITGKPSNDPLHPDYAPSRMPEKPLKTKGMDRYWRPLKRAAPAAAHPEAAPVTVKCEPEPERPISPRYKSISVGTDLSMRDIEDLLSENAALKSYNEELEAELRAHEQIIIE